MKAKFKLNKQTIQDFFLHHGEKLVLIVVVGLFLAMGYYAVARPVYNRSPEDLTKLANQTRDQVDKTPAEVGNKPVVNYPERAKQGQEEIKVEGYAWETYWDPRTFPKQGKRGEPAFLTVQKLRGAADCGAFVQGGGADSQKGRRWIVVTGLVPLSDQIEAFDQALRFMRRTDKADKPNYLAFEVERAEVPAGQLNAPVKPEDWKLIANYTTVERDKKALGNFATDVVPTAAINDRLTFPLGPLANRTWDEQVAHPPEIPFVQTGEKKEGTRTPTPAPVTPPASGALPGVVSGVVPGGAPEVAAAPVAAAESAKRLQLFRFFDFNVQPGRHYRYRVRLALSNPNFGVEARFLINQEANKSQYVWTEWSEASAATGVARDDKVLLVGTKPLPKNYADPEATLMVVKWLEGRGIYIHEKFPAEKSNMKILRGQWLNLSGALAEERAPEAASLTDDSKGRPRARTQPAGTTITYQTDALLIDIRPGERFPGRDKGVAPSEVLLYDYDQSLVVHSDVDDLPAVEAAGRTAAVTTTVSEGPADATAGGPVPGKADLLHALDGGKDKKGAAKKAAEPKTKKGR